MSETNSSLGVIKSTEVTSEQKGIRAFTRVGDYLHSVDSRIATLREKGVPDLTLKSIKSLALGRASVELSAARSEMNDDLLAGVFIARQQDPNSQVKSDISSFVEKFMESVALQKLFTPKEAAENLNNFYDLVNYQEYGLMREVVEKLIHSDQKYADVVSDPHIVFEGSKMRKLKAAEKSVAWAYHCLYVVDIAQGNADDAMDDQKREFWLGRIPGGIGDFKRAAEQALRKFVDDKYGKKRVDKIISDKLS